MRLIDADAVEDTLKKCVSNAYKRRDVQCANGVNLAILQLRNIPTAYSVDEVIKELEEETNGDQGQFGGGGRIVRLEVILEGEDVFACGACDVV